MLVPSLHCDIIIAIELFLCVEHRSWELEAWHICTSNIARWCLIVSTTPPDRVAKWVGWSPCFAIKLNYMKSNSSRQRRRCSRRRSRRRQRRQRWPSPLAAPLSKHTFKPQNCNGRLFAFKALCGWMNWPKYFAWQT